MDPENIYRSIPSIFTHVFLRPPQAITVTVTRLRTCDSRSWLPLQSLFIPFPTPYTLILRKACLFSACKHSLDLDACPFSVQVQHLGRGGAAEASLGAHDEHQGG